MVTYISCNRKWLGFKVQLFFKILFQNICNTLLQSITSRITVATTVVPFFFKINLEEGLPPKFFLSVASSKALIQRCPVMKYGRFINKDLSDSFSIWIYQTFKIAVLNISKKFLEQYLQQNLYSAHLWVFNMCSLLNEFLGISWTFSEQHFQGTPLARGF